MSADVALAVHRYRDVVRRIDMALYVTHLLEERPLHPLHRALFEAVMTAIAGSDPEVAHCLAQADLPSLVAPQTVLFCMAAQRGWSAASARPPTWSEDMIDDAGESPFLHSAAAAARRDHALLARRVWQGELSVLFPFVERQRHVLLARLRGALCTSLRQMGSPASDVQDLEIGQIWYVLKDTHSLGGDTRTLLYHLKEIRHALAHLRSVDPQQLTNRLLLASASAQEEESSVS